MKKTDPDIAEAIAQGIDCQALAIYGSVKPFYAVGNVSHDEPALGFPIACDERMPGLACRAVVPAALTMISYKIVANDRASKNSIAAGVQSDALVIARASTNPNCVFSGFNTLVSERCRDAIAPEIGEECEFVEAEVVGAPGRWFVMWVTRLLDPVDQDKSKLEVLSWRQSGEEILRPKRLYFTEAISQARWLFRLPQWKYFQDSDLCRPSFRELVLRKRLSGFSWITAAGTGPFLKE